MKKLKLWTAQKNECWSLCKAQASALPTLGGFQHGGDHEKGRRTRKLQLLAMFSGTERLVWCIQTVRTLSCACADVPCLQNYWTGCLVRVLILTKSQMDKLSEQYPNQVKRILGNMREHVDEVGQ
eukprot:1162115-Pelagomonas_calceolata.AAC.12